MKNWIILTFLVMTLTAAMTFMADDSYAARMGGGRSFGSQPSMQRPTVAPRTTQPQQRQQPFNSPAPAAPRPSTGMMGGLFGGLLAGTLLGSLLGGGGHAAGAGGGIGFIDIILFGILIWLGFKIFRKMRGNQNPAPQDAYAQGAPYDNYQQTTTNYQDQGGAWDRMQSGGNISGFGGPQVPPGFDIDEFLQGAKAAYVRMQSSWDQRDLNDIALFATDAVLNELRAQQRSDPNPSHTELISINAQLVRVDDQGSVQRAEVLFDVVMREDPRRPTEQVKEIWHFMRQMPNGNWKLDGIQQTY
ncbi:MAG: Tim44 domain-containing protein [Desulfovibrionaceae bacterium]|nr:Tim44 domain-containing protein [Desulfovibrionaceae bacterium]